MEENEAVSDIGIALSILLSFEKLFLTCNRRRDIIKLILQMQEKFRRCTQVVVRGRTRNAIGPQGRVGSTPTISARIYCPQGNDPLGAFDYFASDRSGG